MNSTDKIKCMLAGKPYDGIVGTFWKHIPLHDRNLNDFVRKTVSMRSEYAQDVIKLCCNGFYMQEDWGCDIEWPHDSEYFPICRQRAVLDPMQWDELKPLDVKKGALAREIEAAKRVVDLCDGKTPVLATVFSPLKVALEMTADCTQDDVIRAQIIYHPKQVAHGLEVITEVSCAYVEAMCRAGVDGIFFATQSASSNIMELPMFREYGVRYDMRVLRSLGESAWFNALHIHCNRNIYFDELEAYPVQAFNWEDIRGDASIASVRAKSDKILMGGVEQYVDFIENDREKLKAGFVRRMLEGRKAAGERFIAAPGCVVSTQIPEYKFYVYREALEECARTDAFE